MFGISLLSTKSYITSILWHFFPPISTGGSSFDRLSTASAGSDSGHHSDFGDDRNNKMKVIVIVECCYTYGMIENSKYFNLYYRVRGCA